MNFLNDDYLIIYNNLLLNEEEYLIIKNKCDKKIREDMYKTEFIKYKIQNDLHLIENSERIKRRYERFEMIKNDYNILKISCTFQYKTFKNTFKL